jgi:rubrerythrin
MTNGGRSGSAASQPEGLQREIQEKFAELSRNLSASVDALKQSLEEGIGKLTSSEEFISSVRQIVSESLKEMLAGERVRVLSEILEEAQKVAEQQVAEFAESLRLAQIVEEAIEKTVPAVIEKNEEIVARICRKIEEYVKSTSGESVSSGASDDALCSLTASVSRLEKDVFQEIEKLKVLVSSPSPGLLQFMKETISNQIERLAKELEASRGSAFEGKGVEEVIKRVLATDETIETTVTDVVKQVLDSKETNLLIAQKFVDIMNYVRSEVPKLVQKAASELQGGLPAQSG